MERVKLLGKGGNTSRRQVSIENWVDSIIPEGDSDCIASCDGVMMCTEDDLLLGAEAKMMIEDDAADDKEITHDEARTTSTFPVEDISRNSPKLAPSKQNSFTDLKESAAMDSETSSTKGHVTNDVKDDAIQKMAADVQWDGPESSYERELSWRTKLAVMGLIHMDSIQSQPDVTSKTYTSVDEILEDRIEDPEEILTNLGFANQGDMESPIFKVPVRFLQAPTQASGIHVKKFFENNPDLREYFAAKGVVLDEKCKPEETIRKNTHSFHKIARKVSTMKRATDLMRPTVALFPGLSCTRSVIDNMVTWKVEPIRYVAPSGVGYNSILHPHNARYRAEQGLYETRVTPPPDVSDAQRWMKRRKSWSLLKQQAVGGYSGSSAEMTTEGSRFVDVLSDSSKIRQHNADQKRRMFRDAKGSPLPYPIYRNSPGNSPNPSGDVLRSEYASQNSLQVPDHLQHTLENLPQDQPVSKDCDNSSMLTVPVIDWSRRHLTALSGDVATMSRDLKTVPHHVEELFCNTSLNQLANCERLRTDDEVDCDNEIKAINSKFCDEANRDLYIKCYSGHLETGCHQNSVSSLEKNECQHVIEHAPEGMGCSQDQKISIDSGRSGLLQSFDLEEIQSSDVNSNETQQQESIRKLIHKDAYTRGSSLQSDSSGFGESIDQPESSYELHKKIYAGYIHIGSPVPEANSADSDELQDLRTLVPRLKHMDSNREYCGVVQMVEKQPNNGVERFTLEQPAIMDHTASWRIDNGKPEVGQLVDFDFQLDVGHASGFEKKEYPKEKDPWRSDEEVDDSRKLALVEFGNFLSANSDVTLCESDEEASPVSETVDVVSEPNKGSPLDGDLHKSLDVSDHKIALQELGYLLANSMHTSDAVTEESSSDGEPDCRLVADHVSIKSHPEQSGQDSETDAPRETSPFSPAQVTVDFVNESPLASNTNIKVHESHGSEDSSSESGNNQKESDSEKRSGKVKGHGFLKKLGKGKKKKKSKVLDELAKSTLTGCHVKDNESDKISESVNTEKDMVVLGQLAEITASTGLKVTNVDPGGNRLIRDDQEVTDREQKVNGSGQEIGRADSNEINYDLKRPSFLTTDYDTMHHLVEKDHHMDSSDDESEIYDDARQSLEQINIGKAELQEFSDGSMETAASDLHLSIQEIPAFVTSRIEDNTKHAVLSPPSSSSLSDEDDYQNTTQSKKIFSSQTWPIEPNVKVGDVQDPKLCQEGLDDSVWDKTLTPSDIEYLDNLAIELAVPRCVSSSRALEEAKKNTSQQSAGEQLLSSELSGEECVNEKHADRSELSPLSRFMKKLQPKARSEKRNRAALKKSETIANTEDLRKRHDKGSRLSKPALLRRRRKNRSKSEPGKIDIENLEKLSPASKKKSDSKGFSQWFKNILHSQKPKNLKEASQTNEKDRTRENAEDHKKQQKAKSDNASIHDAISQLALSTLPMNPEVQNPEIGVNYMSADSEASSKWGVSDSDEEGPSPARVHTSVAMSTRGKPRQSSPNHQSTEIVRNECLRSSANSTISELHINLKKTESLETAHKSEVMLMVVDGEVKDVKKCDSEESNLNIGSRNDGKQGPESTVPDDVFVDSFSLQSESLASLATSQRQVASFCVEVKSPESSTVALVSDTSTDYMPHELAEPPQKDGMVIKMEQGHPNVCPYVTAQDSIGPCSLRSGPPTVCGSPPGVCCHRDGGLIQGVCDGAAPREVCQHQILCHLMKHPGIYDLPDSCQGGEVPIWPESTSGDKKQHLLNEVQLLQKALNKYKLEFRLLELKSSASYLSLSDVLSSEDRLAADALRELQHDISNEISIMEQNLKSCYSSLLPQKVSDDEVLPTNMARLFIIREMIELLKEQIYRSSIISVTKRRTDQANDLKEDRSHAHHQMSLDEEEGAELIPQMALLQKQLEAQQLVMARTLSAQLEEFQSTVMEEIRHIRQQQSNQILRHCPKNADQNTPGLRDYEGVSQSTVTKSRNQSVFSHHGNTAPGQCCRTDDQDPDAESRFVVSVSPETTPSDHQISVNNSINLRDELIDVSRSYGDLVTHDHEMTPACRWQQHDSGFKEGEELFV